MKKIFNALRDNDWLSVGSKETIEDWQRDSILSLIRQSLREKEPSDRNALNLQWAQLLQESLDLLLRYAGWERNYTADGSTELPMSRPHDVQELESRVNKCLSSHAPEPDSGSEFPQLSDTARLEWLEEHDYDWRRCNETYLSVLTLTGRTRRRFCGCAANQRREN